MSMNGNIVLIGFMGAGKTTFGRWISENLHMRYIDTDEYIENGQGVSINEIFATKGEEFFRDLETKCLLKLNENIESTVISMGGGMPMRKENQKLMKNIGLVVYLRAPEEELVKRLTGDSKRPLLKGENLAGKIHELMEKRESTYIEMADLILDTKDKDLNQMYNEIEDFMAK